ncbi:MAG: hypothetical protein ACI4PF_00700 [Christensenellales bacterium]
MDLIKNLSKKQLFEIQKVLRSLEFYGVSEETLRKMQSYIEQIKELKDEIIILNKEVETLKKTVETISNPNNAIKKEMNDIAKNCFTLPVDEY